MELYYKEFGEGRPLIILHGLFGASDNWLSIGKRLAEQNKVYLLDQRNHGQSPHDEVFNYQAMAEDLKTFIDRHGLDRPVIMGHSMGGKTVMKYAELYPDGFSSMIVVDIAPKYYPVHHTAILKGLQSIAVGQLKGRQEADTQLAAHVSEAGIRQFLLKNLVRQKEGGFAWKINLSVIADQIESVGESSGSGELSTKPTLFIAGERSDYIQEEDVPTIKRAFPKAQVLSVAGAGHWVHAEQPEKVVVLVEEFLANNP